MIRGTVGRLGGVVVLGLVVCGLAAPGGASGAITCEYEAGTLGGTVFVQMDADGDSVRLGTAGGDVRVVKRDTSAIVDCEDGPATTTNTEHVIVNDNFAGGSTLVEVAPMAAFSPGKTQEGGNDAFSELEITINYGGGPNDRFLTLGTAGADSWRLGSSGINWNAASGDPSPDADITLSPAPDQIDLWGQGGDDTISARGGLGTGAPFAAPTRLILQGFAGDDTIEGGDSDYLGIGLGDALTSGAGDDTVRGFGHNDLISPGPGDDTFDGGAGDLDLLDFGGAPGGVAVDLSRTGPQPTGDGTDTLTGIEQIAGTQVDDTLTGDAGRNHLAGENGNDVIDGRGGNDDLAGGDGVDTATYERAPAGVNVDLGGAVSGTASGGGGNDTVAGFENLIGSPFADSLTGDANPNTITGLGGADTVSSLAGADAVRVRDGAPDTASCGTETDTAVADQQGVDAINPDCETVSFAPQTPDGGTPPSNDFSFGKAKKNKRKGTAILTVSVPGAGDLELAKSEKVKGDDERATAEGSVKLKLKPKGTAKRRLADRGKAKVKAEVTYAPDGGDPATKSKRIKLAKRG
jgi:Ca2+-binding RTX toxin-like protein